MGPIGGRPRALSAGLGAPPSLSGNGKEEKRHLGEAWPAGVRREHERSKESRVPFLGEARLKA